MQVDTNVSEADIGRVARGQDATFTVDSYPEMTFRGRVSEIRNAPITVQNVVTYDVVVHVENKELRLKPGMTANVSVLVAHKEGILKIPNAALRFRPEGAVSEKNEKVKNRPVSSGSERTGGRVWVLSQNGKPAPVSLALGITDGAFSEVLTGSLQEGAEVIVEATSNRKDQRRATPPFGRGLGR
jgi:HlyD family secretion protein